MEEILTKDFKGLIEESVDFVNKEIGYNQANFLLSKEAQKERVQVEIIEGVKNFNYRITSSITLLFHHLNNLSSENPDKFPIAALDELKRLLEVDLGAYTSKFSFEEIKQMSPCEIFGISHEVIGTFYDVANNLFQQGKFKESADILFLINIFYPFESLYWQALGNADYYAEDYKEALYAYNVAILQDPLEPRNLLFAAHCLERQGELDKALIYVESVLNVIDQHPEHLSYEQLEALRGEAEEYQLYLNQKKEV